MYLEYDVAAYFNHVVPIEGKRVLDWGCNHANFIQYGAAPASYDGLDIDRDLLLKNKETWPQHNWHHYPAYNWQYACNPNASQTEWPLHLDSQYDLIVAFSVFTHTDLTEFRYTVEGMKRHMVDGGDILTTFISNNDFSMFCRILSHRPEYFSDEDKDLFKTISQHPYSVLVVEPETCQKHLLVGIDRIPQFDKPVYFLSFYDGEWLADKLGGTVERPDLKFDSGIRSTQQCLKLSIPA